MAISRVFKTALFLLIIPVLFTNYCFGQDVLIPKNATWNYIDNGLFPGFGWYNLDFDDSSWKQGQGKFGYGDGNEQTILNSGVNTSKAAKENSNSAASASIVNMLENGDFEQNLTGWSNYIDFNNAQAGLSVENGVFHASIGNGGTESWHIQLHQIDLLIEYGATYTISFDAWADNNRNLKTLVGMQGSPYTEFWSETVNLTTDKQSFSFEFTMEEGTHSQSRFNFDMGLSQHDVYIDNVVLEKTGGLQEEEIYTSYYFRHTFELSSLTNFDKLQVNLLKDDGAVVYLNGQEVIRNNMPGGSITHTTLAEKDVSDAAESTYYSFNLDKNSLQIGENIIAVEVHQADMASSDLGFDLELRPIQQTGESVTPLIRDRWMGYTYPLNAYYPEVNFDHRHGVVNGRIANSCGPTAFSKVLHYWEFPRNGYGEVSFTDRYGVNYYANIGETEYNFDLMPDYLPSNATQEEYHHAATLIYHAATAIRDENVTGGNLEDMKYGFVTNFRYKNTAQVVYKDNYSTGEWTEILKNEFRNGRVVIIASRNIITQGGHFYMADGFNEYDEIHIRWDFGERNGYYPVHNFELYPDDVSALIGLEPETNGKSLALTNPTGGEEFEIGDEITIQWTSELVNEVDIELTTDGGETWEIVANSVPASDAQYTLSFPDNVSETAKIRLTDVSNINVYSRNRSPFSIEPEHVDPGIEESPFSKGVNLTNWFQYETNAKDIFFSRYTKEDLADIKSLGADVVRLPVNFHHMTSGSPDYTIDPLLLKLLDKAVTWAEELELNLIINNGTSGEALENPDLLGALVPVWSQLANHYKNRSEYIYYEIANEPNMTPEEWFPLQQQTIDAIRSEGDNHTIVVTANGWGGVDDLENIPVYEDNNLIYTFHFYEPFIFTTQGADWAEPSMESLAGIPFPYDAGSMPAFPADLEGTWLETEFDNYANTGTVEAVKQRIDVAVQFGNERGIPLYAGELGVYIPNSDPESRINWYDVVTNYLTEQQISWTDFMGIYEKDSDGFFDHDLNIPLLEVMGFHTPPQTTFSIQPDTSGFVIYDDFFGRFIDKVSTGYPEGLSFYEQDDPKEGEFYLHWPDAQQYSSIAFDFNPDKDLSVLLEEEYLLEFYVKSDASDLNLEMWFLDTKTDEQGDHPWRMTTTIDTSLAPGDNEWHLVQVPLSDFAETGSYEGQWYPPQGDFDWTSIDRFEISAVSSHAGKNIWFDRIRVIHKGETVALERDQSIPSNFRMYQNYPNPFNPSTIISYTIPEKSKVQVLVYNVMGQKVAELLNNTQNLGHHTLTWIADDLPSGMYLIKISATPVSGEKVFISSRKALLIK